jgi:hypothetical protein
LILRQGEGTRTDCRFSISKLEPYSALPAAAPEAQAH